MSNALSANLKKFNYEKYASLIALVVLFIIWSREYQFGSAQRMGPGYFPTVLGWIMAGLGVLIALPALSAKAPIVKVDKIGWRGLLVVLGAVVIYALTLLRLGFVVSLVLLMVIAEETERARPPADPEPPVPVAVYVRPAPPAPPIP